MSVLKILNIKSIYKKITKTRYIGNNYFKIQTQIVTIISTKIKERVKYLYIKFKKFHS